MPSPERKALIIAISDYENLQPLSFCKKDGDEAYKLLKSLGYKIQQEEALIGQVGGERMRDEIINFFTDENIKAEDTVLFYYSGHGVPDVDGDLYLATSDINPGIPNKRGFSFNELTKMMQKCFSTRVVTILDCCYSGAAKVSKAAQDSAARLGTAVINERSTMLQQGEGRCLLAASMGYQEAYNLSEKDHSLFTYYLLEGIKGANGESVDADGNVTPDSLGKYVYRSIVNLPPEKRPSQTPIRKVEAAGDIIIADYPELATKTTAVFQQQLSDLLKEGKVKEFNDLRKQSSHNMPVDLSRAQLHGSRLVRIDLSGANLYRANFSKADLEGANLQGADAREADLEGANLNEANLDKADLEGASLIGANLTKATFRDAILTKANLMRARLFETDFQGAKLISADLRGTNLANANFTNADRTGANVGDVDSSHSVDDAIRDNIKRPTLDKKKILIPVVVAAAVGIIVLFAVFLGGINPPPPGDSTKPNVSITGPTSNSIVSGTVTVAAAASDNIAVTNVDFFVDDTKIGAAHSLPFTISWNSTTTPNGEHTLEAIAYDAVGNEDQASIRLTVDNHD